MLPAVFSEKLVELSGSARLGSILIRFLSDIEILLREFDIFKTHKSPHFFLLSVFVAEFSQLLLALPPVRIDLDEESEEDLLLEEVLHVYAGLGADLLE